MLDERALAGLRLRLAAHAADAGERRQIEAVVTGVRLAGADDFGALRTVLTDLQQGADYHAAVRLVVRTCYGRSGPDPDLVVGIGTSAGRPAAPMEVLAAEVFVAVASGDPEAARTMLHDDDSAQRSYRQRMVLGLLLRWLYAQADAGFPTAGPSVADGRAATQFVGAPARGDEPAGDEPPGDGTAVCGRCGRASWVHESFDGGCPPETLPNLCCGAPMDAEVERPCAWGNCVEMFCVCGEFTGGGWGPAGCPCGDNYAAWHRADPEQRPKHPVPGGARHHRRYRARRG